MSELNRINSLVDKYLFYGFVLLIPLLVLGPAIPDFIIITSSLLFLFFKVKNFQLDKYKNYLIFFFIFYLLIIFSSLISENYLWSLRSSVFYLRFFLYFLVVCYLLENYFFVLKYILLTISLTFIILFIDTLFQFTFKINIIGYPISENGYRIASFFKDEYILGTYILRIFPIFLFCLSFSRMSKNIQNYIYLSIFFASGLIIMLTGDRTPLLLFIIYVFLFFLLSKKKKNISIILISCLVIFSLILFKNSDLKKRVIDQTIIELGLSDKNPGYFFNKKGLFFFSPQHEKLFDTSINIFKENKFFGIGPNNFRKNCESTKYKADSENHYNCYNHPHNLFFQILSECGIFVFLIFILFYLYITKFYLIFLTNKNKAYVLDNRLVFLIISILVNYFPIAPSGNFFNNNLTIFNFLSIALFFAYLKNSKKIFKF